MSVSQHMDRQAFLAHLRQSGLLTAEQLASAIGRLPASTTSGRHVARALVEQGALTRFQAELLLAGRTSGFILGQYRILEQLGRGGMGRVFKAEHMTMSRIVALKVLANHLVKTEKAQQLFQREVRAAARLVHPNIVTAYDANQIDNRYYLVMEYVDGPNLDELVRERGPLPVGHACEFIRQAALGLQFAHEQGMVHRDIKPANLLVGRASNGYTVKILDFGLARLHSRNQVDGRDSIMTNENTVMGTPDFLSPEQARNLHQVDIRSDLYSLGCTLYFLLTAQVPYPGGTTVEKLVRHNTEEPKPVEQLRRDLPGPVAAIVRRLLVKQPAGRFQTPAELAAALAPFSSLAAPSTPVSAPTPPPAPVMKAIPVSPLEMTPTARPGSPNALDLDDECAVGTMPMDLATTPMSMTGMPSMRLQRAVEHEQQERLKLAIYAAIGIIIGLLTLVSFLMLR